MRKNSKKWNFPHGIYSTPIFCMHGSTLLRRSCIDGDSTNKYMAIIPCVIHYWVTKQINVRNLRVGRTYSGEIFYSFNITSWRKLVLLFSVLNIEHYTKWILEFNVIKSQTFYTDIVEIFIWTFLSPSIFAPLVPLFNT